MLHFLSGRGAGASVEVKQSYTAAVGSVLDYSASCLPGFSNTSYQSLEIVQNGAMSHFVGAAVDARGNTKEGVRPTLSQEPHLGQNLHCLSGVSMPLTRYTSVHPVLPGAPESTYSYF